MREGFWCSGRKPFYAFTNFQDCLNPLYVDSQKGSGEQEASSAS